MVKKPDEGTAIVRTTQRLPITVMREIIDPCVVSALPHRPYWICSEALRHE
jgi:hypothetical protein